MKKVYGLIKIDFPQKKGNYLEFNIKNTENIISLGLYSYQNVEVFKLPNDSYEIKEKSIKLCPLLFRELKGGDLLLGAKTEEGFSYFEFPERQKKHLWESYYDFGVPEFTPLNLYAFLNLGGKLMFTIGPKLEIDTNTLRIPYESIIEDISASKKVVTFKISLSFDISRIHIAKNQIVPVLCLVDNEQQENIEISDYEILEENGNFIINGKINLPEEASEGNYCFALEVSIVDATYLLDVYKISKELFMNIHPYSNDRFDFQGYNCEVFWFDREGVIFRINRESQKKATFNFFNTKHSFDKKLSEDEIEHWRKSYLDFEKEWIKRSSYRKF